MKHLFIPVFYPFASVFFLFASAFSQNIAINTTGTAGANCAMLDISSTSTGLLIPRVSLTNVATYAPLTGTAVTSLLVYSTTAPTGGGGVGYYYWDGSKWVQLLYGGSAGTAWLTLGNTGTVDGTNFLGTTDNVPLNFRVFNNKAGRIDNNAIIASTFFGYQAGNSITTGVTNTGIGHSTLFSTTTGFTNTAIGDNALYSNTIGNFNIACGSNTLYSNTAASRNTAVGVQALFSQTYSTAMNSDNVAVGYEALYTNNPTLTTNGMRNTAVGTWALYSNTTGTGNTATGYQALYSNTFGAENTALGYQALYSNNIPGASNTAVGYQAIYSNAGIANTAVGVGTLFTNTGLGANTALGYYALNASTSGNYNIALGYRAGDAITSGSNNIILGYDVDAPVATNSSQLSIGNVIFGTGGFGTGTTIGAGNIGIGTNAPGQKLSIAGTLGILETGVSPTFYSVFQGGDQAANLTYTLPTGYPAVNNYALLSTTAGVMSWGSPSVTSNAVGCASNPGTDNIYMGTGAGNSSAVGALNNVAIGCTNPLFTNSTGDYNIAIGAFALNATTSGNNTALGYYAGAANTTAGDNTFIGYQAGRAANTANASQSTFVGANAGGSYSSGATWNNLNNTFIGWSAGQWCSSTAGVSSSYNTYVGSSAAIGNVSTAGSYNTAVGYNSGGYNLLTTGNNFTCVGAEAMNRNTTGIGNTAIGRSALYFNQTGGQNVAVGFEAQLGTAGASQIGCTVVGHEALGGDVGGALGIAQYITTIGWHAMGAATGAGNGYDRCVALGSQALLNISGTIGSAGLFMTDNTALGTSAGRTLGSANGGARNVFVGTYAGEYMRGQAAADGSDYNVAMGYQAGSGTISTANPVGDNNVYIGAQAGTHNAAGTYTKTGCTFVGYQAGYNSTTGISNVTAIGNGAGNGVSWTTDYVYIGNTTVAWIGGQQLWGTYSDRRLKKNIADSKLGLDFILKLKPVTYEYRAEGQQEIRYTGFIAQDVEESLKGLGEEDFSGLVKPKSEQDIYSLRYSAFIMPLVKGMQEQQQIIQQQQKQIEELKALVEKLSQQLSTNYESLRIY